MFLYPRPASMKRGERVVTIVRRDAMDANALPDVQCVSGRQRRVGLAPEWQVLTPGVKRCRPCGRHAESPGGR
jgi:hypothetical protein